MAAAVAGKAGLKNFNFIYNNPTKLKYEIHSGDKLKTGDSTGCILMYSSSCQVTAGIGSSPWIG